MMDKQIGSYHLGFRFLIVTLRDNRDYFRVLLYSDYTTITWWGVLLSYGVSLFEGPKGMGNLVYREIHGYCPKNGK